MDLLTRIQWLIDRAKADLERPFSLRRAAEYLEVSRHFLYKMVNKKLISYSKMNGNRIYFTKKDLDDFALSERVQKKINKN